MLEITNSFIEKQIKGGYPMVEVIDGYNKKNELLGGGLTHSHTSRFNNLIVPPSLYVDHDLNNYNNENINDVDDNIDYMPDEDFNKIFAIIVIDKKYKQTKRNNKSYKNKTKKLSINR